MVEMKKRTHYRFRSIFLIFLLAFTAIDDTLTAVIVVLFMLGMREILIEKKSNENILS